MGFSVSATIVFAMSIETDKPMSQIKSELLALIPVNHDYQLNVTTKYEDLFDEDSIAKEDDNDEDSETEKQPEKKSKTTLWIGLWCYVSDYKASGSVETVNIPIQTLAEIEKLYEKKFTLDVKMNMS